MILSTMFDNHHVHHVSLILSSLIPLLHCKDMLERLRDASGLVTVVAFAALRPQIFYETIGVGRVLFG